MRPPISPITTPAAQPWAVWLAAALAVLVAVLLPGADPALAAADGAVEARFVALINAERASAGSPPLRVADDLTAAARTHARSMADSDHLHHDPDLGTDVRGWDKVGENVGRGPDVDRVHAAFVASEGHRRNILDPEWTEVGVGVEVVDGGVWVTERFRLPAPPAAPTVVEAP